MSIDLVLPALRGQWSSNEAADSFDVDDPSTGQVLATVAGGGARQVDEAVRRARAVFDSDWRWRTPRERGRLLIKASDLIRQHADELALLESREMGKPFNQARPFDVEFCIDSFAFYGGLADKLPGESFDLGPVLGIAMPEPFGVIGGIIPFNWPPIHTAAKSAPALAAGNTVVLKPPEQDPLTIMRIVELLQQVLPPNVVQLVPGLGPSAGVALAGHRLIGKLSFTGSTNTAKHVLKLAAENITPALLELGGKNALMIFEDADLDEAVRAALEGGYFNQGEACTAASRLLVHASVHDEFVARLATGVSKLRVGKGTDPETHVGPLVTRAQQQRVLEYLEIGKKEGARIVAQAPVPTDKSLAGGFWVPPTLWSEVTPDMRVAREEIFGPVSAAIRFESEAEGVRIANDVEYGLVAGVYTRDHARALRVARQLEVGVVMINNYNRAYLGSPFGGMKASGYGREHAVESLREFTRSKNIRQPSGRGKIPTWHVVDEILGAKTGNAAH